jgi:hypothetical protein
VVREGVGAGEEMTQALYAHMNNKRKRKKKKHGITLLCISENRPMESLISFSTYYI